MVGIELFGARVQIDELSNPSFPAVTDSLARPPLNEPLPDSHRCLPERTEL